MAKARKSQKKGSKKAAKNGTTKKSANGKPSIWPPIIGILALIIIIGLVVILVVKSDQHPVKSTYPVVLDAFAARNVSEFVIVDLTNDFISGEYTLKELGEKYPGFEEDIRAVNKALKNDDGIVAVVNGEELTRQELSAQIALLPQQYRDAMNDEQVLQQMIDERLLIEEATRLGFTASDEEIDQAYADLLSKGGLAEEELLANIESYGLTKEDIRSMLEKQILIDRLFNATIDKEIVSVSDEEVKAFYAQNREQFAIESQVKVRHILFAAADGRTQPEALAMAEAAIERLDAGEDFCDLVTELTDDRGSLDTCGEYTFGRGFMVPEFEEASYRLAPGEREIVQTQFGQHLIEKLEDVKGSVTSYEDVEPQIRQQLETQARLTSYQEYINALRAAAEIDNRLTGEKHAAAAPEEEPGDEPQLVTVDIIEEETTGDVTVDEEVTGNAVTTVIVVAEEPEAAPTGDLATCLEGKDATLYVANWASASMDEAEKYGDLVTVVNCDAGCAEADLFPTWKIDGEEANRRLSESELMSLAGC